ncbi:sterol desaturase family protein [Pontibacterium sp. N1Y112]|uniref:Sterol desaturase family protein n=1 Tax=Pontibacterium sinense TaxID=2781979 RepID=A0A8J7FM49_9GAMM|nr:sterol desaturase family protein [Pontibacterium sinense]MBE9397032.1 sterol desaturase family protein [Pontibacterium sinense]
MDLATFITTHETTIRLSCFLGILLLVALWELVAPRRTLRISKAVRWANNLGLVFLNSIMLRQLFPAAAVGVAVWAQDNGWGLFNLLELPFAASLILGLLLMDLAIYAQHVLFHHIPVLWRLHRVHHVDLDYDVTTGARFHPIEIILSMLIKFALICVLGVVPLTVILFELILNGAAMFNHGNIRLPNALDRYLRLVLVTPDMHRVHHSIQMDETNSNFGFNLPWWDRLFGTYKAQPDAGQEGMQIGVKGFDNPKETQWLPGMLWVPFRRKG